MRKTPILLLVVIFSLAASGHSSEPDIWRFDQKKWNRIREALERGVPVSEAVSPSTTTLVSPTTTPPPPPPSGISVELPYESQLSLSGRKTITLNYQNTNYLNPEWAKKQGINPSTGSLDMKQELQVRIQGKVGRKTTVNVDFDDTTADKRDISITYRGDPDEVLQELAFGDITMSLPSTEFVGYSRQLFGIRAAAKYKKLRAIGFFSQTKGLAEVKRFTGNTHTERPEIKDISYIRRRYYALAFGTDTIKPGSEKIYLDDRNYATYNVTTATYTVYSATSTTPIYTGSFDLLRPGQDYIVDYSRQIIYFRRDIQSNYIIAVDYTSNAGTSVEKKIIKYDESLTSDPQLIREIKSYYYLGHNKIVRDNGRGNFILKVIDYNLQEHPEFGKYPDNIQVDFENGYFNFFPATATPFPAQVYSPSPTSVYKFLVEYRWVTKTYMLRPGIVPQSERVTIDGQIQQRDLDYFIDYDAGIVTFLKEDKINENSVIDFSYEYSPFGTSGGSTMLGTRLEYYLLPNWFIGGTYLSETTPQLQSIPDIRTAPTSLQVMEVDSKISDLAIPYLGAKLGLGGEYAASIRNYNTAGKAIIESMEGIKQEDSASLLRDAWTVGKTFSGQKYYSSQISWDNEEVNLVDINPNLASSDSSGSRQVLSINYNLTYGATEVALVQALSNTGLDFSKKIMLEMWVYGDNSNSQLLIDYGSFSEDVDGSQELKTEDVNRDGTLNAGEDIGWPYRNPDGTISRIGANNGKIDSNDLDRDGSLRTQDLPANPISYGINSLSPATANDGNTYSQINFSGWKLLTIPLNITNETDWQAIKQVRLTIRGGQSGNIKIAGLTLVSNRFQKPEFNLAGSSLTITAKNTEDDPTYARNSLLTNNEYIKLYNLSDYEIKNRREQTLAAQYYIPPAASTTAVLSTTLTFGREISLLYYRQLKFFFRVINYQNSEKFFIRLGNENNYFEYRRPLAQFGLGWQLANIELTDINGDGKPDLFTTSDIGAECHTVGSPSLENISQIKVGVISNNQASAVSGEFWLNDIFVTDSREKSGQAQRFSSDLAWPGISLGGTYRYIGPDFENFTSPITNQTRQDQSAYLNFNKISFLPIGLQASRSYTLTPSVYQIQGDQVSILQQGRVLSWSGQGNAALNLNHLPTWNGTYSRSFTDTEQIQRLEDRESFSHNLSYTLPLQIFFLPTSVSGSYSRTNTYFRPWRPGLSTVEDYLQIKDFNSLDYTDTYSGQAPFRFGRYASINLSGNLSQTRQLDNFFPTEPWDYPKALNLGLASNCSLQLARWFSPTLQYNINTLENYDLTYSTTGTISRPARSKVINRTGSGSINWNLNLRDIVTWPMVQSLGFNSAYRLEGGDTYENVLSTYSVLDQIIFTEPLRNLNPDARQKNLTRRNSFSSSGRWNPLEFWQFSPRLSPLKTLSVNFNYSQSKEDTLTTETPRHVYNKNWPDLLFGLNSTEQLFYLERWLYNSQVNFRWKESITETASLQPQNQNSSSAYGLDWRFNLLHKIDWSISYNTSDSADRDLTLNKYNSQAKNRSLSLQTGFDLGRWRLSPRLQYQINQAWDSQEKLSTDLTIWDFSVGTRLDISNPTGIKLPFFNLNLGLTNRLIFDTSFTYNQKRSSLNVERDNVSTYSWKMNGDYEISNNFRASANAGLDWVDNQHYQSGEGDYYTISFGASLIIQF